jgi:hypothetical protein
LNARVRPQNLRVKEALDRTKHVTGQGERGALAFGRAFLTFARWRACGAVSLLILGALFDGVGLLMLVPLLDVVVHPSGTSVPGTSIAAPLARLFDRYWEGTRLAIVLTAFVALMLGRGMVHATRDRVVSRLQFTFVEAIRLDLVAALTRAGWPCVSARATLCGVCQTVSIPGLANAA